jgi:hypothetical protein
VWSAIIDLSTLRPGSKLHAGHHLLSDLRLAPDDRAAKRCFICGDTDQALKGAAIVVDEIYTTPL